MYCPNSHNRDLPGFASKKWSAVEPSEMGWLECDDGRHYIEIWSSQNSEKGYPLADVGAGG